MKKSITLLLFCGLILSFACKKETINSGTQVFTESDTLELRLKNNLSIPIDSFYINTSGGVANFDLTLPQQYSDYALFDFAYSYFYIRFIANNQEYILQPFDYVGESKIENGKYTIQINSLNSANKSFNYQLVRN